MRDITKYQGIIPAFYACYEEDGSISTERTKALAEHLCGRFLRRMNLPEQGGTQGSSGSCDGNRKGKDDRYRPCGLQQYGGQL